MGSGKLCLWARWKGRGGKGKGRWKVEGGRWKVECGRWKVEGKVEGLICTPYYISWVRGAWQASVRNAEGSPGVLEHQKIDVLIVHRISGAFCQLRVGSTLMMKGAKI